MLDRPEWFSRAIAVPGEPRWAVGKECAISYLAWGVPRQPLVILVHGRAAHARWWDHIAPFLADGHRVVAVDLAGHGDSGWREFYGVEAWAEDIMLVAREESDQPPLLVGHSMGANACAVASARMARPIRGLVLVESPIGVPPSGEGLTGSGSVGEPVGARTYDSEEDAVAHFRVLPPDPVVLPFVERHIAEHSVRQRQGNWVWKFDPMVLPQVLLAVEELRQSFCPVALVRGERGMCTAQSSAAIAGRLGPGVTQVEIPDAGHHIMLGQPIALVAVLRMLVSLWGSVEGFSAS